MTTKVMLTLPDELYQQIAFVAQAKEQDVPELLAHTLQRTFAKIPLDSQQIAMYQEQIAYEAMHADLVKDYDGHYVAIYQGELVDHDVDLVALVKRRNQNYPNKIVMITQVEPLPNRTLQSRSPRLI